MLISIVLLFVGVVVLMTGGIMLLAYCNDAEQERIKQEEDG